MLLLPLPVDTEADHTACVLTLLAPAPVAAQSAHVTVRMEVGVRLWKRFGPLHVHTTEADVVLIFLLELCLLH